MAKFTFKGGIHPYDGKDLSKDKPIIDAIPGEEMVFPLSQHIGAPAKPLVKKGDAVLRGQMIAEAGGFVSAPVYSSVSGTVKNIEKRRVATGDMVESIIIANDGFMNEYAYETAEDWSKLSREQIIAKIAKARDDVADSGVEAEGEETDENPEIEDSSEAAETEGSEE